MFAVILFVVLLWGNASAFTADDCPHSIAHDKQNQVLGNKCFRFFLDVHLEYEDAQRHCKRRGGNLAMVKTKVINDFLTNHLIHNYKQDGEFWIGLTDVDDENDFEWVDGSPLGSYSNWADSDEGPRGGIKHMFRHHFEDCVAMDAGSNGQWRDFRCEDFFAHALNEHKLFICEFTMFPKSVTTPSYPQTTTNTSRLSFSKTTVPKSLISSTKPLVSTHSATSSSNTKLAVSSTPFAPSTAPVAPSGTPLVPSTRPLVPSTRPLVPSTRPVAPSGTPLVPSTTPVAPSGTPLVPSTRHVVPSTTPLVPSTRPVVPSTTPVAPSKAPLGGSSSTPRVKMIPTTSSIPQTTTSPCGKLVCNLDCGMSGFELDTNGCLTCQCDSK